jgi:hypothetical protein
MQLCISCIELLREKTNSCGNELLFVYWNEFCGASIFLVAHGWGRCLEDCKEWSKHISKVFLVVSFFHSYKTHGTILLPALIFNKWINSVFAMYIWKMVMCKQSSNPTCIIQQFIGLHFTEPPCKIVPIMDFPEFHLRCSYKLE